MARGSVVMMWLTGMLGAAHGFQLHALPVLQPKMPRASTRMTARTPSSSSVASQNGHTKDTCHTEDGNRAAPEKARSRHQERFDWKKQWYPVLAVKSTDPGRAHAVQLLGKDLVVWKNSEGTWATFDDRCPHRGAPLTEGRVEKDGSLLCAYHAWRFNSEGICLNIPQSERGGKDELSPAACLEVYPTQVAQDIIWVWGDNGPDAGLESAVSPAALIPVLEDAEVVESGRVSTGSIYQRDVPYAWETFVENFLDPSHVTVAHHGIMGSRDMAAPVRLQLVSPTLTKDGFVLRNNSPVGDRIDSTMEFHPPALVAIDAINKDGSVIKLISYSIPTRPGWCRMLFRQVIVAGKPSKESGGKQPNPRQGWFHPHKLPEWLQHLSTHLFVHQDLVFLHHQEKILASAGIDSSNYASGVFTPAASDKGVTILRKWVKQIASGGPAWSEGCDTALPPREHNRDVLFDVYRQHTQGCTICMGALTNANRCLFAAKASAVASLTWAILRGARALGNSASPSPSVVSLVTARAMLPALATMSIALGAIKVLDIVIKSFKTGSFHHQDND